MNYDGMFVFVENAVGESTYYNGEWLVLRSTPTTIYVIKPTTGHNTDEVALSICRKAKHYYNVLESYYDWDSVEALYHRLLAFSNQRLSPRWIEAVYDRALNSARRIGRLLEHRGISLEAKAGEQSSIDIAAVSAKLTDVSCRVITLEKWADRLVDSWKKFPPRKQY